MQKQIFLRKHFSCPLCWGQSFDVNRDRYQLLTLFPNVVKKSTIFRIIGLNLHGHLQEERKLKIESFGALFSFADKRAKRIARLASPSYFL